MMHDSRPYLIFALPRSRTAWLARFLSYGDWHCGHEELRYMRGLDDIRAWATQPCTGTVETVAAPWWRLVERLAPSARMAVVRRPVAQVVESLMALPGITFDRVLIEKRMAALDRKLEQIANRTGCLSVTFDELATEDACARLFEYCLPYRHDHAHWAALAPVNVQCNMQAMMRYCIANEDAMARLGSVATQQSFAAMALRKPVEPDAITFQLESFEDCRRDGAALFEEHCVQVGEPPEQWQRKNHSLMERLDSIGAMRIMTARSNGRMLGYLMALLAPSLTSEDLLSATNLTFFASQDAPGIGMKLQRAMLAHFKDEGVGEVFWEVGKRGSGPRIDALYRRLGAIEHGQAYRLDLAGV